MVIVHWQDVNRYVCVYYVILDNELGSIKPDDMSDKNKYIIATLGPNLQFQLELKSSLS